MGQPGHSILLLAPQPFFQNRGTPIAVKLLAEELARLGHKIDLLVFHEGEDVQLPGVTVHRIPALRWVRNIPPSLSWKKLVCDLLLLNKAVSLLRQNRYSLMHAVEESVFWAYLLKKWFRVPYVYDMDSSLPIQVADKFRILRPLLGPMRFFERRAVRGSIGVVAVCQALEEVARAHNPGGLVVRLEDISLLAEVDAEGESLRDSYQFTGPILLYVGNLEGYQGIDLLLASWQRAVAEGVVGRLVIIGGTPETIDHYRQQAAGLGVGERTTFCGPRPVEQLGHYLRQADILLSPRVQGNNTPMKLYSYLDSGKPVLATRLATHTQVLDEQIACLVEPNPESMAQAMVQLLGDPLYRQQLGERGREVARASYSLDAFRRKLQDFYGQLPLPPVSQ